MIPYGKQSISKDDITAVMEVLKSDFLTQGPKVPEFETKISEYCDAEYAVAVNSATSALHLACLALGLGEQDILWTTPITFVASANCGLYCGASVDFVDIDPDSYNMSMSDLEARLIKAEKNDCLPKIVIPVHFSGQPCHMERIFQLSEKYGFRIIEDASHAIGARYKGEPVGNCRYSDVTVFSFHPVKIITTGEGGIAVTNDRHLAEKMKLLRSHGVSRDECVLTEKTHGDWYYQQVELGFNYRMTDLQAALGVNQLTRLDLFIERRLELFYRYQEKLKEFPVKTPFIYPECRSSHHLYPIQLNLDEISLSRKQVFDEMRKAEVGVNVHYIPVHTQPYFQARGFSEGMYPASEEYYARALSLPLYPDLSYRNQDKVINSLKRIVA